MFRVKVSFREIEVLLKLFLSLGFLIFICIIYDLCISLACKVPVKYIDRSF